MVGPTTPELAFRISVGPDDVVRLNWLLRCRITGALAVAAMAAVDELNGARTRPLLVEMAGSETPTREAREHFGRRCTASRIALLGVSAVDRMQASFAPRGGGFPVPTDFFTSETAALAWLLGDPWDS